MFTNLNPYWICMYSVYCEIFLVQVQLVQHLRLLLACQHNLETKMIMLML